MKALMADRGRRALLPLLVVGAALLVPGAAQPRPEASVKEGGTFRVSLFTEVFDYVDPALAYGFSWTVLDAVCARLMNYPDKAPPTGLRLVPEVAASHPRVSRDAKVFTFTLRPGFRFSDGTPVRADAFARAISRILAPGVNSPAVQYVRDIVGAEAVLQGKRATPAGVVISGNRLVIRFKRPVPDFPARTTMPFFCAVPPTLPSDPEGIGSFPGSGPYYVAEYVRGQRIRLERNRFYGGRRPHHVDRFDITLEAQFGVSLDEVESGKADWAFAPTPLLFDPARGLVRKYGINRSQFFVVPGLLLKAYQLNNARPLFRNNLRLRRAVNSAIDRRALLRGPGGLLTGRPTEQHLPPTMPGFRDAKLYPLDRPDLRKARSLARGSTRAGKAILWTFNIPLELANAQIVKRNLKQIGLDVQIKGLPPPALFSRIFRPDAAFDIARVDWISDYFDPFQFTNALFDSQFLGLTNVAHFSSRKFDVLMRRAARLQGNARYRAFGNLDVTLARDAAPIAPFGYASEATLVSKRVGCIILRPQLDLTAVCLK
jgi:peptide/nickel transport system substrate-binding protein